jgi:hypothetical protein
MVKNHTKTVWNEPSNAYKRLEAQDKCTHFQANGGRRKELPITDTGGVSF